MGFLTAGKTLTWEQAQPYLKYVKDHGVEQFIHLYNANKDVVKSDFLWGDEVEFILVKMDPVKEKCLLLLRGGDVLDQLQKGPRVTDKNGVGVTWHPEFGSFMVEATPDQPYSGLVFQEVEENMRLRREHISSLLAPDEKVVTVTSYPRMGAQAGLWNERRSEPFTFPAHQPGGESSMSEYTPDAVINPHPRFGTLVRNIRNRRGTKVCICSPLFMDRFTKPRPNEDNNRYCIKTSSCASPTQYYLSEAMRGRSESAEKDAVIHMDAMVFGMGCCCLQVTFQCCDLKEARYLNDQLAVLCPYMLAVTAACPILKGLLAGTDARWDVISAACDDRDPEERGRGANPDSSRRINKSRYDSISLFISESPRLDDEIHNDITVEVNQNAFDRLTANGIDKRLATHVAHLFVRNPLVIYDNKIEMDDSKSADHWENIQSTNWQSVRFKPPPPGSHIGWRVEFRVMEIQITDFENAAFSSFMALFTRVILYYDLNLYIPICRVDQNMQVAQCENAVRTEKFWFRDQILEPSNDNFSVFYHEAEADRNNEFSLFSIDAIMNGSGNFKGLIAGVKEYMKNVAQVSDESRATAEKYINLVSQRSSGKLETCATWMRKFVKTHNDYKQDSVVTESIAHDLISKMLDIADGKTAEPALFGDLL